MRVIAGQFKGRKLVAPKTNIEPTKDMVKEALFSIIGQNILAKRFIDLFAGCGNIGIEALSRGADEVVFVEHQSRSVDAIHENLNKIGARGKVIKKDVFLFLKRNNLDSFDYIFADPPYNDSYNIRLLVDLSKSPLLNPDSIFILEHRSKSEIDRIPDELELFDQRKYGITSLSFFSKKI